jgi:hypothetical protein
MRKEIMIDEFITHTMDLDHINDAFEPVLVVFSVFWVVFCYLFSVFFCLRPASCMLNIPSVSRLSIIAPSLYTKVYLNTDGQQLISLV